MLRLVLPVVPPLLVSFLIIGDVISVPRSLPAVALWLIMVTLYARMWIFLVRDARRLADEAAAIDQHFRDVIGDGTSDGDVAVAYPARDPGIDHTSARGAVIALVGRPIDAHDASTQRFPLTAVGDVRARLDRYMARVRPSAVVCSAGSGADLLALDVAEARSIRSRVVLPCGRARFRHAAVTNRPGTWGRLFDRIIGALPSEDVIIVADYDGTDDVAAVSDVVNAAILDQAAILAAAVAPAARGAAGTNAAAGADGGALNVVAVLVWEGRSDAAPGANPVAGFRSKAERRGIRIDQIVTATP